MLVTRSELYMSCIPIVSVEDNFSKCLPDRFRDVNFHSVLLIPSKDLLETTNESKIDAQIAAFT